MAKKKVPPGDLISKDLPRKGEVEKSDDAMASDIKKAKKATGKILNMVQASVSPVFSRQGSKIENIKSYFIDFADQDFGKKLLRFAGAAGFLVILLFIGSLVLKTVRETKEQDLVGVPGPTVGPFRPYKPSVYADDEGVLQMEEDAKVLNREVSTAQLKETILTPPVLDFNINFK